MLRQLELDKPLQFLNNFNEEDITELSDVERLQRAFRGNASQKSKEAAHLLSTLLLYARREFNIGLVAPNILRSKSRICGFGRC